MVSNMTLTAYQYTAMTQVDIGESFTFVAEFDFPGISVADKSDLTVEVFAMNADNGKIHWL